MGRAVIPEARGESAQHAEPATTTLAVSDEVLENLAGIFKLLADETRLRILMHLAQQQELHVQRLCDLLHESQPAVSHHLGLLRTAGIVERRREGKHNYYSLRIQHLTLLLDLLFTGLPEGRRKLRLGEYLLAHAPD